MQRELNSSLLPADSVDLPEGRVLNVVIGIAVVRDIEDVEGVGPEAQALTLGDVEVLEGRGIDRRIAWRSFAADTGGSRGSLAAADAEKVKTSDRVDLAQAPLRNVSNI